MSKISDLPIMPTAKGKAYIPVVDPGEGLPANRNKRILLSTLTAGADNTNFAPYDPAVTYSKTAPDFVSYNGNTYEYINATPAAGKTPATEEAYWQLVSAGRFTHRQNTDTGTNADVFTIGNPQGQDVEGSRVMVYQEYEGGPKMATRYYFDHSVTPAVRLFQLCRDYTGTGADVWEEVGGKTTSASDLITGTLADARLTANIPRLDSYNEFNKALFLLVGEGASDLNDGKFSIYRNSENRARFFIRANGDVEWGNPNVVRQIGLNPTTNILEADHKFNAAVGLQHKGADLTANKTGGVVDFVAMETHFGSESAPEIGNITANTTGAVVGHMAFMTHKDSVAPAFSSEFHKVAGSGDYVPNVNNYIYFDYRSSTRILYSITQ